MLAVYKELALIVRGARAEQLDGTGAQPAGAGPPTVFITGETGTGKELVAQFIHGRGDWARGQFLPINCSNLTPELAEAELFGHEPGAFTGASRARQGLWELADGGTLFLDEITEAPPAVLPKLLRVLQDGMFKRLGSNRWRRTNVQVIAATNRDMQRELQAGRFRSDLYHRLSLHQLHLPPLRERLEDVPSIIAHLVQRHNTRALNFARDALELLMAYPFPGNVRELENIVRWAARRSPDGMVYAVDLCAYLQPVADRAIGAEWVCGHGSNRPSQVTPAASATDEGLAEQMQRVKLRLVQEALARYNGNATQTARALKISRPSLYRLLKDIKRQEDNVPDNECKFVIGHDQEGQGASSAGVN